MRSIMGKVIYFFVFVYLIGGSAEAAPHSCYTYSYQGDVAVIESDGKEGIVDLLGVQRVPCIYDRIYPFVAGVAMTQINDKFGVIDSLGNVVLENEWTRLENTGYSYIVKNDSSEYSLLDKAGKYIDQKMYDYMYKIGDWIVAYRNDIWSIYSLHGDVIIEDCEAQDVEVCDSGFISVYTLDKKYMIMDTSGKIITNRIYDEAYFDMDGIISVSKIENEKSISGMIDYAGNILFEIECDLIYSNNNDYIDRFAFVQNGKVGCVGMDGRIILEAEYDAVYPHPSGKIVVKNEGTYYIYNPENNEMQKTDWDDVYTSFVFSVKQDRKIYILSNTTCEPIPGIISYDKIDMDDCYGILVVTNRNSSNSYYLPNGMPLSGGEWLNASIYANGYAHVRDGQYYRIIDMNGRYTTDLKFKEISPDGYDEVEGYLYAETMDGRYVIIDEAGNPIASSTKDEVYPYY